MTIRERGYVPHWESEGATYFVTFRLADSLPQSVLAQIASERAAMVRTARQLARDLSPDELKKLHNLSTQRIEQYLDKGAGACHLNNPTIARVVAEALRHFDGTRYRNFAWCVMPNHVHALFGVMPGFSLASVMHSWKSFTAKEANRILKARGDFWQREYYDHLIRNQAEFERAVQYIAENPVKAGLRNWPWVWVRGSEAAAARP